MGVICERNESVVSFAPVLGGAGHTGWARLTNIRYMDKIKMVQKVVIRGCCQSKCSDTVLIMVRTFGTMLTLLKILAMLTKVVKNPF